MRDVIQCPTLTSFWKFMPFFCSNSFFEVTPFCRIQHSRQKSTTITCMGKKVYYIRSIKDQKAPKTKNSSNHFSCRLIYIYFWFSLKNSKSKISLASSFYKTKVSLNKRLVTGQKFVTIFLKNFMPASLQLLT